MQCPNMDASAIYYIKDNQKHRFPNHDVWRAFGSPKIVFRDRSSGCSKVFGGCQGGYDMPHSVDALCGPSAHRVFEGAVVRCESDGGTYKIENGKLRWYSLESWNSWGNPAWLFQDTGNCTKISACPAGNPVPVNPN